MIWMFVVDMEPVASPRYTQVWNAGKRCAFVAGLKNNRRHPIEDFKAVVAGRALECRPPDWRLDGPMILRIEFIFPGKAPVRLPRAVRPDLDNLERGVCDALKLIAWNDDSQVVSKSSHKGYGARGEAPHAVVQIAHAARETWPPVDAQPKGQEVFGW